MIALFSHSRLLIALLALLLTATAFPAPPPAAPPGAAALADGAALQALLESPHWPLRAFGVLRLERYERASAEPLLRAALRDRSWAVRCFAVRQAAQAGIELTADDFADETSPMVVRAALRAGVRLPAERIRRGIATLLRAGDPEQVVLGIEIAAASGDAELNRDAGRRFGALIAGLDDRDAAVLGRRMAVLAGLDEQPTRAADWRRWAAAQRGLLIGAGAVERDASAAEIVGGLIPPDQRITVAGLDERTFARLADYLGVLKQRDLDVVVVMDATASMLPMMDAARAGVGELIAFLGDIARTMRLGFVAYRDHDNEPVQEHHALTGDVASIRRYLLGLAVTGGEDLPEAVLEGLAACANLQWNPRAARQIVLVGDAPPHDEDAYALAEVLRAASSASTAVHAVHVPMQRHPDLYRGLAPDAVAADRRELAEYNRRTGAAFTEIARLGGGRMTTLDDADRLVPQIMRFSIDEPWWAVFDEFYARYLELCR